MKIENGVVIGLGELPIKCAALLKQKGISVVIIEAQPLKFSNMLLRCNNIGIKYLKMSVQVVEYLHRLPANTLIISASNNYIFDNETLSRPGIIALNYHNSLLPLHRCMNAEAWAIYQQDQNTGITWHLIDLKIDVGLLAFQEEISILPDETSFQLLSRQAKLAYDVFQKEIDNITSGEFHLKEQCGASSFHKINDIPNDGYFSLEWGFEKSYAFLRAMDYGRLKTLGDPKIIIDKKVFTWRRYHVLHNSSNGRVSKIEVQESKVILDFTKGQIILDAIQLQN